MLNSGSAIIVTVLVVIASSMASTPLIDYSNRYLGNPNEESANTNADTAAFSFAAAGDWGCTDGTLTTAKRITEKNPEIVLGLGDYSYDTTADCWLDILDQTNLSERMKISIGNHETTIYSRAFGNDSYKSSSLLKQYMDNFGLKYQFYSFDYHNVHFLGLATELPLGIGSEQYEFVENDLAASSSKSGIDWRVAYFHYPMYPASEKIADPKMFRELYHPLFDKYGVDLVLQGHDHNYQRSFPLQFNSSNPTFPKITSITKSDYVNPEGEIFVIIGTGGQSLYKFLPSPLYVVQTQALGFMYVDFVNNGLTMRATFYGNDSTAKDSFVIVKWSDA